MGVDVFCLLVVTGCGGLPGGSVVGVGGAGRVATGLADLIVDYGLEDESEE